MRAQSSVILCGAAMVLGCGTGADSHQPAAAPEPEWPIACRVFPPVDDEIADCARRGADGELVLRPGIVSGGEDVDPGGVVVDGEFYFALPSGRTAPAFAFDNGLDEFVEGLARSVSGGKFGFVDRELNLVIPRTWDFAFPFENGLARVCKGCTIAPAGEHGDFSGGTWSTIDREARIVEAGAAPARPS